MKSAYHRVAHYCHFFLLLAGLLILITARPASADKLWTDGLNNGEWYTGTPAGNWDGNGIFNDGDNALFDNTAPPAGDTVTIFGTVNPAKVTVNNADYTFLGSGSISNAFNAALYKTGSGTLTIANSTANTYSGATNVQGGTLKVDLSNLATPTNLISSSSALAMSGSSLVVTSGAAGASSQTFNGATFSGGDSMVKVDNTAAGMGNSTTLALGALIRSAGATVNFSSFGNDSITTTTGNTSGIIGSWATFNNNDWATASGAGPTYTIGAPASYTDDTWASGNNTDVTGDSIQTQDSTTNSLRFNLSSNATVLLSSANGSTYNTIQSGGILVGSGNIANQGVSNYEITGGNLTSGGSELIVNQRGSAALTIDSTIVDRGANAVGLTKSGPGLLLLSGANTYTGGTMVNAGILAVKNTSGSGTGYGNVNVAAGATLAGGTYSGGNSHGIIGTAGHLVSVTIASGGILAPSGPDYNMGSVTPGGPNNLVINGNLTLSDNSILSYVLSNSDTGMGPTHGNDLLTVSGTVGVGSGVALATNQDFSYGAGTYTLINGYSSAMNSGNLGSWQLAGYDTAVPNGSGPVMFSQSGGAIVMTIPAPAPPSNSPPEQQPPPPSPSIEFPGFSHGAPPQEPPASPMDPKPSGHFVGCNENVTNHSGAAQSSIDIVLNGDWTGPGVLQGNYPTFGVGNTKFTPVYNSSTMQTTLTISSKNGATVPAGQVAHVGYSLLNGMGTTGEGGSPETAYKYWGAPTTSGAAPANPNYRLPAPTFFLDTLSGGPAYGPNTQFLILYSTIELGNSTVGGEWSELQVPNGGNIKIGIGNNDNVDGPMFSFDTKFFLSDTQIPLDDLNNLYEPPTGSNFQPLPGIPDGTQIMPGGTMESGQIDIPAPEPGSVTLLALGAGSVLFALRRSRRGTRR